MTIHSWPGLGGHKVPDTLLTIGCRQKAQMLMQKLHSSLGTKYGFSESQGGTPERQG